MSETLLDKAKQNYEVANTLFQSLANDDEAYLNYVGYHLQQAVEIAIKYELSIHAVPYQKTDDITQLIQLANQNGVDLNLPEYIDDHSEMFTLWESRTRYIINYRLEKRKIERALEEVRKMLEQFKELSHDNEHLIEM